MKTINDTSIKKNKFSELNIDELIKKKKSLNGLVLATAIVMLLLCSVLIFLVIKVEKFSLLAVIPASLLCTLPSIIQLKQVNDEIKSRGKLKQPF